MSKQQNLPISRIHINEGLYFFCKYAIDYIQTRQHFDLHYHPYPEIYCLIQGKGDFIIEGSSYELEPNDIILIPAYTLHQPHPEENILFERYVLNIYPTFYEKMYCQQYESFFSQLDNFMYKIPGRIVKQKNLVSLFHDLKQYSDNFNNLDEPAVFFKIGEILHILNSIEHFENYNTQNPIIQEIIDYIDKNFTSINSLKDVADKFNYSKNHLGYIFKSGTGMTISDYVTLKKIEYAKILYRNGTTLTTACMDAGFNNYGSFAYNYKKLFGTSPREDLE